MAKRSKDTDYLFLSNRIHVLERSLITRERMERMLEAQTNEEAAKVLVECGYPEMPVVDVDSVNATLAAVRDRVFEELYADAPDPKLIDVFKVKYDYHNVKTLLKAEAMGVDPGRLLVEAGRFPAAALAEAIQSDNLLRYPTTFAAAVQKAREVLHTTQDPQLSDFVLDRAYFQEMEALARETGSAFLMGYVEQLVDVANLRSIVRVRRMGKSESYLKSVLFPGGRVSMYTLLDLAESGEALESVYGTTALSEAAEAGQTAIGGGSLTAFEKACDNALMRYVAEAKYVPFGDAAVIGYLAARDSELTAVRIIMTGRLAGLDAEVIRERMREAYV